MNPTKVQQFIGMCGSMIRYPVIKIVASGLVAIFNFLLDWSLREAMIAVFILIMFDFVTAIMAVRRHPSEKIESRRLWVTAGKVGAYFLLISSGNLAEEASHHVLPFIDETIIAFLAMTELLSILENAGKMGYAVPKKLIEKISKYRDTK